MSKRQPKSTRRADKSDAATARRRKQPTLVGGLVRALLPLNILELLAQQPQHGLQIAGHVEGASGGAWSPSPGTLYPMLQRMQDDGLLRSDFQRSSGAPRRVYRLTAKGRRARDKLRQQLVAELRQAKALVDQHLAVLESGEPLRPHSQAEMEHALDHGKLR